jgi:hypothetical protein
MGEQRLWRLAHDGLHLTPEEDFVMECSGGIVWIREPGRGSAVVHTLNEADGLKNPDQSMKVGRTLPDS